MKQKISAFFSRCQKLRHRLAPKPRKPWVTWTLTISMSLLSVVFLLFACLLIGTQDFSFTKLSAYFEAPLILVMNLLPMVLVLLVCYALTNRAWIAWLITAALFLLLFVVNYFKVALRGEPFLVDDLLIAGEGLGILDAYTLRVPKRLLLIVFTVIVLAVFLCRYARGRVARKRWWVRVMVLGLCAAMGAAAWSLWYTDHTLYSRTRLSIQHTFTAWRDEDIAAGGGLVWSFLRSIDEAFPSAPEGYDEDALQAQLAEYPDIAIAEEKRVNVVVTMLESFSDFSVFDSLRFTDDPYKNFHALQDESYHGTLIVDSIGGGTVNAERAFLTGFAYRQPTYSRNTVSFPRYFSDNGYVTTGGHPGVAWFYSRESINRRLGFDSYQFYEGHFGQLVTPEHSYFGYLDDEAFFADRRQAYEQRDRTTPYFSFSVTYQGHSPYHSDALDGGEYISHEGISDGAYYSVNNYLNSIAQTDQAIADYVDSFRDDPEPVVLVFFGDHKPTLGDSNSYYEELGILNELNEGGIQRQLLFSTPYLIWANDAAKEVLGQSFEGEGETISPCYLMSVLFDCCGWEGPTWLRYQRTLRETLPVLHYRKLALVDGKLTQTFPAHVAEAYTAFEIAEYYIRRLVPQ